MLAVAGCRGIIGVEDRPLLTDGGVEDASAADVTDETANVSAFCTSLTPPPGFCDDFDVLPFVAKWDNAFTRPDPGVGGGGVLEPDTVHFLSPPRSALLQTPPIISGGGNALAWLISSVPKALRTLDVFVAIRIDTEFFPDGVGHTALLGVTFPAHGSAELRRFRDGNFLYVGDGVSGASTPSVQPFPVGVWRSLEMRFVFDTAGGPNGVVRTYVDGLPNGSALLPPGYYSADEYPRITVGPGIVYGPIGEFRMNADNVALRGTLQ